MFLFWLFTSVSIGLGDSAKRSYNAYQFKKNGGIEAKYPGTFGKKYQNKCSTWNNATAAEKSKAEANHQTK